MTIDIQYTSSEPNRIRKSYSVVRRVTGTLRNNSSIIDPQILIEGDISNVATANYMTIYEFKRHYFITNIESVNDNLYVIHGHVDVLTSFSNALRSNSAIVHRQANNYNLYLDDGVMKIYQNPIIETYEFTSGFSGLMYVMPVIG